jgi:plastocyanin
VSKVISVLLPKERGMMNNNRMFYFKWFRAITLLACTVMLLTACGSGAAHFTIEAKDNLTFTPDRITVKPGQTVELTLVNSGRLDHTFSVPELNIEVQMRGGETNKIAFTAPKAGEYPFSSGVIRDFETMQGKLIVK